MSDSSTQCFAALGRVADRVLYNDMMSALDKRLKDHASVIIVRLNSFEKNEPDISHLCGQQLVEI